jgi:UDP-N-acetylmuramoyl-tripeptide--D-alanyl-D-alanine ligase
MLWLIRETKNKNWRIKKKRRKVKLIPLTRYLSTFHTKILNMDKLYQLFQSHSRITIDSRSCTKNSLFFALKGYNFDGNDYAAKALQNGCAFAVVDNEKVVKNEHYILVDDVLKTLQKLANFHRNKMKTNIIAITGTNGKTTTKELAAAVLGKKYNTLFTQGNFNNHIGVPLTLLRLTAEHKVAIVEMGANHLGEIKMLSEIVEPNFGLITNIGKAHLEGFGSFEGVLAAKTELYNFIRQHNGRIFINPSNETLTKASEKILNISYSLTSNTDVCGHIIEQNPFVTLAWNSPRFSVATQKIQTNLIGDYNIENLLAAITIGLFFEVETNDICDALQSYVPQNHRSQFMQTTKNLLVIDAYNANPSSMEAALTNFVSMKFTHKAAILGDMLELGSDSDNEHKKIIEILQKFNLDNVFLIGENFAKIHSDYKNFANKDEFIKFLQQNPLVNCEILIKGSNRTKLEEVVKFL